MSDLRCPHLPSVTATVMRVRIERVGTPRERDPEPWEALICDVCARAVRSFASAPSEPVATLQPAAPRSRAGNWYVTIFALECYCRLRGYSEGTPRVEDELRELLGGANYKQTDSQGRELWRTGGRIALRIVVSYERRPEGPLPQVVWVGQGRPPERHWSGQ